MPIKKLAGLALVSLLPLVAQGEQELLLDVPPHKMEMTVDVHPDVASVGDTLTISISATNREHEAIRLKFRHACRFGFRITGPDGNPVQVRRYCPLLVDSLVLAPGAGVEDTFRVALAVLDPPRVVPDPAARRGVVFPAEGTLYDPSPRTSVAWPTQDGGVTPGVYRIEGGIWEQEFWWAADEITVSAHSR